MSNRATQAELLEQRIAENLQSQEIDLTTWIFQRLRINPPDQILELCCGTGSQTLPMLRKASEGRVVAVDVSQAALEALNGKTEQGESCRLTTVQGNLDDLPGILGRSGVIRRSFDLTFCAYGLYYSRDPNRVLNEIVSWLKPEGRIAVVGPYGPNNEALFDLVERSGATLGDAVVFSSSRFMLETVLPWASLHFESVRVSTMVNPVRWISPERVLTYWENTTFYDAQRRIAFEALLRQHFAEQGEFVNKKWVMMVEMQNARD